MPQGFISIGSNIDRDANLASSLKALKLHFDGLSYSSVYETEAVGFSGNAFYNMVVGFQSELSAKDVAKILKQIELEHGRSQDSQKFSSRTLDLDLLVYGDQIINEGRLQIPRDEIEKYAFVLEPLSEVAPSLKHPVNHRSYRELWDNFDKNLAKQQRISVPWLLAE